MDPLIATLRSMKRIAPDGEYVARSRRTILALASVSPVRAQLASFMRGVSVAALAGLAMFGGVSLMTSVRPGAPAASLSQATHELNAQTLAAEAQTVETQLAMADVQHQAVSNHVSKEVITTNAALVAKSAAGTLSDGSVDRALAELTE